MSLSHLEDVAAWMFELQGELRKALETLDSKHIFEDPDTPEQEAAPLLNDGDKKPAKGKKLPTKVKKQKDVTPHSRRLIVEGGNALERAHLVFTYGKPPVDATREAPKVVPDRGHATFTAAIHPRNPYAPSIMVVLRFAVTTTPAMAWHMDASTQLAPAYGFDEDALHWHQTLYDALAPHDASLYPALKKAADERFALPHRKEQLGIGGVSMLTHSSDSFDSSFSMLKSLGAAIAKGVMPILTRRVVYPSGERERTFQQQRRGRLAEYFLHRDPWVAEALADPSLRQHADAVMPPSAIWSVAYELPDDTWERRLHERYLVIRDWRHEARAEPPMSSRDNPVWPPKPAKDDPPPKK